MTGFVIYDTGMLLGLAHRSATARVEHERIILHTQPVVPGPVLAEVWQYQTPSQVPLSRYLRQCQIYTAYSEIDYKRVGIMLDAVTLPPKKRSDVVDALVALTAAQHKPAAVLTSDPLDITAYLDTMPKARTIVVPV